MLKLSNLRLNQIWITTQSNLVMITGIDETQSEVSITASILGTGVLLTFDGTGHFKRFSRDAGMTPGRLRRGENLILSDIENNHLYQYMGDSLQHAVKLLVLNTNQELQDKMAGTVLDGRENIGQVLTDGLDKIYEVLGRLAKAQEDSLTWQVKKMQEAQDFGDTGLNTDTEDRRLTLEGISVRVAWRDNEIWQTENGMIWRVETCQRPSGELFLMATRVGIDGKYPVRMYLRIDGRYPSSSLSGRQFDLKRWYALDIINRNEDQNHG